MVGIVQNRVLTVNLRGNAEVIPAHVMVAAYPGLHDLDIPLAVERVAASIL